MIKFICPFTINWNLFSIINACLAITGAIRATSEEKLYLELGLGSLQLRRWYRKLRMFYKIYKSPQYLFKLIPEKTHAYTTRNTDNIPCFKIRHNFKNSFFPSTFNTYLLLVSSPFSTHSGLECILLCHRSDGISPFGSVTSQRDI